MALQKFLTPANDYAQLDEYLSTLNARKIMLVHGKSMTRLAIGDHFARLSARLSLIEFTDFTPNPEYRSIERGVEMFNGEGCDALIAVGGGSAIDTAKCIKLFSSMPSGIDWIAQPIVPNDIPLIAIPTTGGSGSEATQFAVLYRGDKKFSLDHESALPHAILLDASTLLALPDYQKKATLLDAMCHALESSWSIRSNNVSHRYALEALRLLVANMDQYVGGALDLQNCTFIMYAANLAGRAINISRTTAGHAMSYRLTKKFGLAHGHAVARCVVELWKFMLDYALEHGRNDLLSTFDEQAEAMGCRSTTEAIDKLRRLLSEWQLYKSLDIASSIEDLASSVNLQRLANNPVKLNDDDLRRLYRSIGG